MRTGLAIGVILSAAACSAWLAIVLMDSDAATRQVRSRMSQTSVASSGERTDGPAASGKDKAIAQLNIVTLAPPSGPVSQPKAVEKDATDEEKMMSEVIVGLLELLDEAVKAKDPKRVAEWLAKLKSLNYGSLAGGGATRGSGRASAVKQQVLELFAAMGPVAASELVGEVAELLEDSELAVSLKAKKLIFETLKDATLSDRVRAEIVTAAAAESTDAETISRLFQEFIRMRPSVGIEAFKTIDASGTEVAKSLMARTMGGFTSNPEITTVAQLEGWFEEIGGDPKQSDDYYGHENLNQKSQ